jgi:glycosyltransferase involved in cell wall biosynthesis
MKIGILGSRGIPNRYGGFEQFAEYLSVALVQMGHTVYVYNSHLHPYKEDTYMGVHIVRCFDAEDKLGTAGQFVYDLNCILHSRRAGFDVLLQLGYTSSSVWGSLLPRRTVVATNMDGLEWKRTKFSKPVRRFLQHAERWGVRTSDYLIADSVGIQQHLLQTYGVQSVYIPYGAHLYNPPIAPQRLHEWVLQPGTYDMLIARLEPENSIEPILEGVSASTSARQFLVIGNHATRYGEFLKAKFPDPCIRFMGAVYDMAFLNELRWFSNVYYHGHTVGGTNPSLLEAMASGALICAHGNIFNRSILGNDALYFASPDDVQRVRDGITKGTDLPNAVPNNQQKIGTTYSWENIVKQYEQFLKDCFQKEPKR